ncbi:hypothetical protein [Mycobacterium sp. GA-2829]|uniref:hypothetical protein n=1 Tax=Mycobacterium sp. GA-2829 TaxID=1772283 RepID=UPI0007403094|nr:hypothetical protein [Mycobacterium sp. GA-2829]KUI33287.1 hypothetical protein AU194_19980 [Mycobacterium sp. GA-2829]
MDIKRVLAGASIVGVVGLPAWFLGVGVAAAEPVANPECADPAACERAPEEKPAEKKNTANKAPIQIPEAWSREVAKNVANLPSPVEANASVPVSVGLPDFVLPDVVPDISVPFILNPPAVNVPGVGMPSVNLPAPKLGPPNNPLNLGPPNNPLKLPKIGF